MIDARWRALARIGAAAFVLAGTGLAQAQDVPPPSPYALPPPGVGTDPDDGQEPIRPWRHWGDHNNQGGFVKSLLAPDPVMAVPSGTDGRRLRFCRRHPDQCPD